MANVRVIPPDADLLLQLAQYVCEKAQAGPLQAADTVIFLPSHRARARLQDVLRGRGGLLPQIHTLGEPDTVWLAQQAARAGEAALSELAALPQQADEAACRLLLAEALSDAQGALFSRRHAFEHCVAMAHDIWQVFDALARAGRPVSALAELAQTELSAHWQERLGVLRFAAQWWDGYRTQHGLASRAERLNAQAALLARCWREAPPQVPVILAGSTGSQQATQTLMRAVLALPRGGIWLPGGDAAALMRRPEALPPTHPDAWLARLLAVLPLDAGAIEHAEQTALERGFYADRPVAMPEGVIRLDARDEEEEARLTALLAREALQKPGGDVAIISACEIRIRRIQAALRIYGLRADSAVGLPVMQHPAIGLWLQLMEAAFAPADAAVWLALLKHPLLAMGGAWVEAMERGCLRGRHGGEEVVQRLRRWAASEASEADAAACERFLEAVSPWLKRVKQPQQRPAALFDAHGRSWEGLLSENNETTARAVLDALRPALSGLRAVDPDSYPHLVRALLQGQRYFPEEPPRKTQDETQDEPDAIPLHPRLKIYSPIEARLMRAERVMLTGLNEGDWPAGIAQTGWMHPVLADALGLPDAQASIAQAAHDFIATSHMAPECFWLRPARAGGTETIPARWLERFVASQHHVTPYAAWLAAMQHKPALQPAMPPAPCPPLSARPAACSVSACELLLRDPYAFYARYILGLRAAEPLDRPADAALRGQIVHRVLERFTQALEAGKPLEEATYRAAMQAEIERESEPLIRVQWAPRMLAMAPQIVALERARRAPGVRVEAERRIEAQLGGMVIDGRIDRLERDGAACRIIDYKTGNPPDDKELEGGFAPQLPLLALLCDQALGLHCDELAYWKVAGVGGDLTQYPAKGAPHELTAFYRDGLARLFAHYATPESCYHAAPQPAKRPQSSDYASLSREAEWLGE